MEWSQNFRSLRRGAKVATRIVKAKLASGATPAAVLEAAGGRLVEFDGFGDNPGRLQMRAYLPVGVAGRPLVVLLHGCGQDAAVFARDSGWADLADRLQFALLLPEQADANNAGRCFQWFEPSDTARGMGEAGSIAAMTQSAISRFDSDAGQVFIVGLSAGGAMAAVMLAAYPDVYAAGASVAGLPVGSARSGLQAILRMAAAGPDQSSETWVEQVRAVAPAGFSGPWPRLSIWQGLADMTVAPENATLLAAQWRALHGLTATESDEQVRGGVEHRMWPDSAEPKVELWRVPHLPHGYPAGSRVVPPGRFVEQATIDATAEIARFFGLEHFQP
jgi:poly(hydroxyalkanoate) depolymerase family esterase